MPDTWNEEQAELIAAQLAEFIKGSVHKVFCPADKAQLEMSESVGLISGKRAAVQFYCPKCRRCQTI